MRKAILIFQFGEIDATGQNMNCYEESRRICLAIRSVRLLDAIVKEKTVKKFLT